MFTQKGMHSNSINSYRIINGVDSHFFNVLLQCPFSSNFSMAITYFFFSISSRFAGGALKHGPFALLDEAKRTPVVLIVLSDQHANLMANTAEQVKGRGAYLITIVDDPNTLADISDEQIVVPPNGPLTALICTIPLQLIAYELAVLR